MRAATIMINSLGSSRFGWIQLAGLPQNFHTLNVRAQISDSSSMNHVELNRLTETTRAQVFARVVNLFFCCSVNCREQPLWGGSSLLHCNSSLDLRNNMDRLISVTFHGKKDRGSDALEGYS